MSTIRHLIAAIAVLSVTACGGGVDDADDAHDSQSLAAAPSVTTYPYRLTLRTWSVGQRGYATQYLYYRTYAACSKAASLYSVSISGRVYGQYPSTILRVEASCGTRQSAK